MRPGPLASALCWLAIAVFLAGAHPGGSQTWIQWSSVSGGNDHYYALTLSATNWTAAQKLAVSWGGTLATVTSSNEQNFINTTFLTGAFEHRPLWIGLRDPSAGGALAAMWRRVQEKIGIHRTIKFRWVTGEPFSYSHWKDGEPNDSSPGEDCVAINWGCSDDPPRGLIGDWNDAPRDGTTGYGGKTDGPYFGLVERETDPRQPTARAFAKPPLRLPLIVALVAVLIICVTRFRRRQSSVA